MAIKAFAAIMGIFAAVLVFVGLQDFYLIDQKSYKFGFESIRANSLQAYSLDEKVSAFYEASAWVRYIGGKDLFNDFAMQEKDFNLSANELEYQNDMFFLKGDVRYADSNATSLFSNEFEYNRTSKILSTNKEFEALQDKSLIKGQNLSYDTEAKTLEIKGAKAWLNLQ